MKNKIPQGLLRRSLQIHPRDLKALVKLVVNPHEQDCSAVIYNAFTMPVQVVFESVSNLVSS